ncbi:hypothetical protein RCZ02_16460 [Capnocytophaga felis]|uniref:hypothetical protein n=1 Tax=Capnocytophaga felis TaxID=2267611 RepID=UPI0012C84871|nr:hypothetical protein [Capnocytophaga felis]GET48815.1 hypothetical protein RCZ02_16460 [Capnocytophaga felis]
MNANKIFAVITVLLLYVAMTLEVICVFGFFKIGQYITSVLFGLAAAMSFSIILYIGIKFKEL